MTSCQMGYSLGTGDGLEAVLGFEEYAVVVSGGIEEKVAGVKGDHLGGEGKGIEQVVGGGIAADDSLPDFPAEEQHEQNHVQALAQQVAW